jgi:3',5'-cyclic AMP phosphodiesterase CpdA
MFVLAHLSDPHLLPLPEASLADFLGKRATGLFNLRVRRGGKHRGDILERVVGDLLSQTPHHIAVTGDLANLSLAGEFAPARAFLERLAPPAHVTVVPGNHDAYVRAEALTHLSAWREYLRGDEAGEARFPFVRKRGPVALIGLSTALPTLPFSSAGKLGREQIESLAAVLRDLRQAGLFRVVLIHHPPAGRRPFHKRLIDAAAFRATIAEHGAELVLHGHDHRASLHGISGPGGPVPVIGVPSASAATHDPRGRGGYNLYRIAGRQGAWRIEIERRGLDAEGKKIVVLEKLTLGAEPAAKIVARSVEPKTRPKVSAVRRSARSRTAKRSRRARR